MREFDADGIKFEINGLTRKAFKTNKLSDYGFEFFDGFRGNPEGKEMGECTDKFIKACINPAEAKQLEDLTPGQTARLFKSCIKETYGSEEEEKNSQISGTDSPETKKK